MEDGALWWAYYNPSKQTFVNTGVEYGYEEYGNVFGGFYGYYGSRSYLYAYENYASATSAGNDPLRSKLIPRVKLHPLSLSI